jgi:hypothetical protein
MRPHAFSAVPASLLACALAGAGGCDHADASAYMKTPGTGADRYVQGSSELGVARLRPDLCQGLAENVPDRSRLDPGALVAFLQRQGMQTSVRSARADLVYVDVTDGSGGPPTRLRVAILDDALAAGKDLHQAILQHGEGSWGVHRSNLAVLAPIGSVEQILAFAGRTKLACWGVLTVAGRDDDFVVPGGYMEF